MQSIVEYIVVRVALGCAKFGTVSFQISQFEDCEFAKILNKE